MLWDKLIHPIATMTASNTLAFFKTPMARDGFSSDSAFNSRTNRRHPQPVPPQLSPASLTATLPNPEGAVMLGLAVAAVPAVVYSLLQLAHLMSGNLLTQAIQAFQY